ncbi:MAG: hypothetical protein BRC57_09825 [Cyanobacteria bacterium QS_8_48_54]|nr:MAG: hypothetical protein BRC35_16330 [Cyanobacteria bacterium QH_10_48_56]PSP34957.1 MAG: hypothetical protein BRC57_09825 [Cyanobacteria bacterium QS_8_48_54]
MQPPVRTPPTNTGSEIQLLLCCAHAHLDTATAERIKALLQQDIDWIYLIEIASQHEVVSPLYQSLNATSPEAVPEAILNQLRKCFHANAQHTLFSTRELLKLLNLFDSHNISAIPFKGPILAASAYDNLALRQFCDLDILIDEPDTSKATDLLLSQGYEPPSQLAEAQKRPYLQCERFMESGPYQGSYNLVRKDRKVAVELHWSLTKKDFPFPIDFKHLWQNTQPVSLAGTSVLQFSPEDLLLFLCMHGSKHCWSELKWLCDVAEVIHTYPEIDWEQLSQRAKILGSDRMLWLGLFLARELLGVTLPEAVLSRMQADAEAKSLAGQVRERIFERPPTEMEKHLFLLRARESPQDKLRYLLGLTFTPTAKEWETFPLPKSLYFAYHLIRPIRLMSELGWHAMEDRAKNSF